MCRIHYSSKNFNIWTSPKSSLLRISFNIFLLYR
uniref:Uncharacterized protein n=1 Tax=Rhizophora mucronata TaxID=61149 RepID=A0A2P2QUS1_RHIMU